MSSTAGTSTHGIDDAIATRTQESIEKSIPSSAHGLFDRNQFLLRQKHLSIDQKYHVFDEQGKPILYVKRRAHMLRNVGALLAAILTMVVVSGVFVAISLMLPNDMAQIIGCVIGVMMGIAAAVVVGTLLVAKRHIEICTDAAHSELALTVLQDKKWFIINRTFTAADPDFNLLGWFRKNHLYDLFRKRWYVHGPDGELVCIALEDSMWRSILRRFVQGSVIAMLLRTNFILLAPDGRTKIGEFNRKFTLFDKYVLDLSGDAARTFDRRLAVALGVLLDTGERR